MLPYISSFDIWMRSHCKRTHNQSLIIIELIMRLELNILQIKEVEVKLEHR